MHYYVVLLQCTWPSLDVGTNDHEQSDPLYAVVLSDTHLLGSKEGHWFDQLRREWQMERAFQTSMLLHRPEAVFVLGDLFDEGKWCSDAEFDYHVNRFKRKFQTPENTDLVVVAGNHDIGFHYMVDDNKHQRFAKAFNASSARMVTIKNNIFVLLNSMAFEGDGCAFCQEAEDSLNRIIRSLDCAQGKLKDCSEDGIVYSRPVVLQHYPLFRPSDSHCSGPDAADASEKYFRMRPRWSCLAKEISDKILERLQPRLVLSGHTHNFCHTLHKDNIPEWTLPSFSWRNKRNPSFLLLVISKSNFAVSKCFLPDEFTVIGIYIFGCAGIFLAAFCGYLFERQARHSHHVD